MIPVGNLFSFYTLDETNIRGNVVGVLVSRRETSPPIFGTVDNLVALQFKYDQARRRFVEWAQNEIAVILDFHKRILCSDEAHFWLNGYVNKQNCHIWSEANPQVYLETPLHPEKLTVWCALWAGGIIGPYFFKNDEGHSVTVNGDRYRAMITNFFIPELNNHDVQELGFQQDGATCHTARATIDLLYDFLENIDHNLAYYEIPAQLACAYLKGHLKGRALDWFEVLGYRVIEDKTTDYAHLKQALSEQFPVVRNRSELETRFYSSSQRRDQQPSDFIYELLKIHKVLKLEMSEEKLIDHVVSRLEPQILDYVEVRHPRNTANLLQIVDKYEERFMHRQIRGSVRDLEVQALMKTIVLIPGIDRKIGGKTEIMRDTPIIAEFNRFENQGFANRRFEGRRQGGQSDQPFRSQGDRQSGSRNSSFRGQNERSRNLNF
ncbi:uncharacterized protein TNCV_1832581 [Trichonephila clavipes]|nr:uncharacterized protein TNCV_1832581 [Trichonephila clavipes]